MTTRDEYLAREQEKNMKRSNILRGEVSDFELISELEHKYITNCLDSMPENFVGFVQLSCMCPRCGDVLDADFKTSALSVSCRDCDVFYTLRGL